MKTILIYPGRFQPFCKHHYMCYKWAVNQFGNDNCYIATSNKTELPKSLFNFKEKQSIIHQYGINNDKIIEVKNPYNCTELLKTFNNDDVCVIYLIGYKDKNRFKISPGSYYQLYNPYNKQFNSYKTNAYIVIAPYVSLQTPDSKEYSGTNVRNELYNICSIDDKDLSKSKFKSLMGWYDDKLYDMICNKIQNIIQSQQENIIFSKQWWNKQISTCIVNENLLCENGVGGHIQHIFDIDWVHSGKDIIKCFYKIIDSLKHKAASLKLDGINVSLKIVNNQFVVDRGSNKERDIKGITLQNVDDYINSNSILNRAIKETLTIFNYALSECKTELQQLGLLDDSTILLNCEYINGKTNIIDYGDKKIISIIGVSKQTNINNSRQFTGISYNNDVMNTFIKKINNIAKKYKYQILGNIKCELIDTPDLDNILTKYVSIYYTDKKIVTKSLYDWLSTIKQIPLNKHFKSINNKQIPCVSQNVLITLLNKTKLTDYIIDEDMYPYVIEGYITYLSEMLLGQAILDKIKSTFILSDTIEGVVINDNSISNYPIKITGDFILKTSLNNKK